MSSTGSVLDTDPHTLLIVLGETTEKFWLMMRCWAWEALGGVE